MKTFTKILKEQVRQIKAGDGMDFRDAYEEIVYEMKKEGYNMYAGENYKEDSHVWADELYDYLSEKLQNDEECVNREAASDEVYADWHSEWYGEERSLYGITFKVYALWIEDKNGAQRELTYMLTTDVYYDKSETYSDYLWDESMRDED